MITHLSFGKDALEQVHEDGVVVLDLLVKDALHVAVRTQALLYMSPSFQFGHHFDGLEIVDVVGVVEHEADDDNLFVDLERVAGKGDPFEDDAVRIVGHDRASRHQPQPVMIGLEQ